MIEACFDVKRLDISFHDIISVRFRPALFTHRALKRRVKIEMKSAPSSPTLYLDGIPPDQNTEFNLCAHFCQFGKVVRVNLKYNGDPSAAAVVFSTDEEAKVANQSPILLLDNKHIKMTLLPSNVQSEPVTNTRCVLCNKDYRNKWGLKEHVKYVHEQAKFQCAVCKVPFASENMYRKHLENHQAQVNAIDRKKAIRRGLSLPGDLLLNKSEEYKKQISLLKNKVKFTEKAFEAVTKQLEAAEKSTNKLKRELNRKCFAFSLLLIVELYFFLNFM